MEYMGESRMECYLHGVMVELRMLQCGTSYCTVVYDNGQQQV